MPAKPRSPCQICSCNESKYTCSTCMVIYCSVACYKLHKESSCDSKASTSRPPLPKLDSAPLAQADPPTRVAGSDDTLPLPTANRDSQSEPTQLRPLTSLKWPYVPEESMYPDPLKRDDPKPLQLSQYEAIATSPAVRKALETHPHLPALLISIDKLRGQDREDALQRALGVTPSDITAQARGTGRSEPQEDVMALRGLAEAIEAAVRGGKQDALGLDWGLDGLLV